MLAQEAKEQRDNEFKSLAQNLHHLMSTQHIRGVFNPIPQLVMVCLRLIDFFFFFFC